MLFTVTFLSLFLCTLADIPTNSASITPLNVYKSITAEAPVPDASAQLEFDLENKMSTQWHQNILYPVTAYTQTSTCRALSGRISSGNPNPHPPLPNIHCNTIFPVLSASLFISGL